MKLTILFLIISINLFGQVSYNPARKLIYVRTCNIHNKKPPLSQLNDNTFGYNTRDSLWYSAVNGQVVATEHVFPYSTGLKRAVTTSDSAVTYSFSSTKKMYYVLTNSTPGNMPITADFPTSIYRCRNLYDSLEYDRYNGVVRKVWIRYAYNPYKSVEAPAPLPTLATRIYVSSSEGSDSSANPHDPLTPYRTITKVNAIFSGLNANDSILFKTGDTFTGTITAARSYIYLGSYGTGLNPVISGFQTVTSWTNEGGGIYSKSIPVQSTPNVVTVNGVNTALGRYPNDSFLTIDSHVGTTTITDAATPSSTINWTGSTMVVRFAHWLLNKCPVTNHSGTTITYTNPISYAPTNGYGFFLENDTNALDILGEWAYRSGKLYMYFGSADPDTISVKVSVLNKVVSLVAKNYITIENLDLQGANVEAVYSTGSYNKVKGCNISFCGDNAVTLWSGASYNTIENCTINHIQNRGILGIATNPTIKNNYIHNIAMLPGMGNSVNKAQTAISLISTGVNNSLVEYNRIDSIGYQGVLFSGNNSIVRYNYITNFGFNLDDGAGIYTGGNNYVGRKIYNNIVVNNFGTTASLGTSGATVSLMGIYLDDNSRYVDCYNNSISDVQFGIFLHGSHETEVYNNSVYNTSNGIGYLSSSNYDPMRNNDVRRNKIVAPLSTQYVMYHTTWTTDVNLFGAIDSNYYCRPLLETNMFKTVLAGATSYKAFAQWKTYSSLDANSFVSPFAATEFLFEFNSTSTPKAVALTGTWYTLANVAKSGSITIQPYSSIILIK